MCLASSDAGSWTNRDRVAQGKCGRKVQFVAKPDKVGLDNVIYGRPAWMSRVLFLEEILSKPTSRRRLVRVGVPATVVAAALGAALIFMPTLAAATVTVPDPTTQCTGSLAKDPIDAGANGEPTLVGYSFSCSSQDPDAGAITSYTLVIDRANDDGENVSDFNPNPGATFPTGSSEAGQPDLNTAISCAGATEANGIDCFAETFSSGTLVAAPGTIPANEVVSGWITPSAQICKYLPKGAKPGTPAVPRAIVELIVTDAPDAAPPVTLSSALTTSGAITALPVTALTGVIPSGTEITVTSAANTQTFVSTAEVLAGATSIPVTSATPNFAYPTSSTITSVIPGAPTGYTEDGPFELSVPSKDCKKVANVVPKPKPKPKPKKKSSKK